MNFLQYVKQYHNFDIFLVLMDNAGYPDDEIMEKCEVSKQRIYDAKKRLEPVFKALEGVDAYKRDGRDKNIQSIIDTFSEAFGTTKASQYDRFAAKRLHVKHGAENIVKLINALAHGADDQYCPSVNSVSELEKKLVTVIQFVKKQATQNVMVEL